MDFNVNHLGCAGHMTRTRTLGKTRAKGSNVTTNGCGPWVKPEKQLVNGNMTETSETGVF